MAYFHHIKQLYSRFIDNFLSRIIYLILLEDVKDKKKQSTAINKEYCIRNLEMYSVKALERSFRQFT